MKKSNLVTLLSLFFLIVAVILFMFLWKAPSAGPGTKTESNSTTQSNIITTSKDTSEDTSYAATEGSSEASTSTIETSTTDNITTPPKSDISMDDALFIGDSRTVGLMEYAGTCRHTRRPSDVSSPLRICSRGPYASPYTSPQAR